MSYFIAHSVRFNKTFTKLQFKGGDNNVVPRCNDWTGDICVSDAYHLINDGSLQFRGYNEKLSLLRYVHDKSTGGSDFHLKLINEMQSYSTAKNYVVMDMFNVVKKVSPAGWLWVTREWEKAKFYGKYASILIAKKSDHFEPVKKDRYNSLIKNR
jgi:hypothetical protein